MFLRQEELSKSSLPGLWKSPSYRKYEIRTGDIWLKCKRHDDSTDGLWRVHDGLYDFSNFIDKHPGGSDWLINTKGTDITEAFEAHHIKESIRNYLQQYYVKTTHEPRFSPYTFHEDGFFRTIRKKAQPIIETIPTGPALRSKIWMDIMMVATIITMVTAAAKNSYLFGIIAAVLMNFTIMGAHNFLHLRENFRMYYFDISFMSSRDWRITHALSHHMYPNTLFDFELCFVEKLIQWMPIKEKSLQLRFGSWIYGPVFFSILFFLSFLARLLLIFSGYRNALRADIIIPFIPVVVMYIISGTSFQNVFNIWVWIVCVTSFMFGYFGVNGAHHHPNIFHDGDTPRGDRDFGLGQMDATRDHVEFAHNRFIVLLTFGEHTLHHLFPTMDHTNLHHFYPIFHETCKEFGVKYRPIKFHKLMLGQYRSLASIRPNPVPPR